MNTKKPGRPPKKEKEIMVKKNVNFPENLWQSAMQKAASDPTGGNLSQVIRRLVSAWLAGKFDEIQW